MICFRIEIKLRSVCCPCLPFLLFFLISSRPSLNACTLTSLSLFGDLSLSLCTVWRSSMTSLTYEHTCMNNRDIFYTLSITHSPMPIAFTLSSSLLVLSKCVQTKDKENPSLLFEFAPPLLLGNSVPDLLSSRSRCLRIDNLFQTRENLPKSQNVNQTQKRKEKSRNLGKGKE